MPSQIGNDKRAIGICQTRCKGTRRNLVAKLALGGRSQFPDPTVISAARRATDYATVLLQLPGFPTT